MRREFVASCCGAVPCRAATPALVGTVHHRIRLVSLAAHVRRLFRLLVSTDRKRARRVRPRPPRANQSGSGYRGGRSCWHLGVPCAYNPGAVGARRVTRMKALHDVRVRCNRMRLDRPERSQQEHENAKPPIENGRRAATLEAQRLQEALRPACVSMRSGSLGTPVRAQGMRRCRRIASDTTAAPVNQRFQAMVRLAQARANPAFLLSL